MVPTIKGSGPVGIVVPTDVPRLALATCTFCAVPVPLLVIVSVERTVPSPSAKCDGVTTSCTGPAVTGGVRTIVVIDRIGKVAVSVVPLTDATPEVFAIAVFSGSGEAELATELGMVSASVTYAVGIQSADPASRVRLSVWAPEV